jgi:hypothetical protein
LFSALGKYVKSAFQADFTYSSAASRRIEFSRGFQPTGWLANIPASHERRLNSHAIWRLGRGSIVADATVKIFHAHRGLKPAAKFNAPLRGGEREQMDKVELEYRLSSAALGFQALPTKVGTLNALPQ